MITKLTRALKILCSSSLPLTSRISFLLLSIRRRLSPADGYRLGLSEGSVFFAGKDILYDYTTFWDIFILECYSSDFRGSVVLDIGAHKGYFGAFALAKGASAVYSFEPEDGNFKFLSMAVDSFNGNGQSWIPEKCAVGSKEGTADLHVTDRSWSHSIIPREDRPSISVETVSVKSFSSILNQSSPPGSGKRLIAKIDAEGAVCDILLGTPVDQLYKLSELFFEYESFSPCSIEALLLHLKNAGLETERPPRGDVYHLRRNQPHANFKNNIS
jgi:FkbM family methyltransferase